MRPEINGLRVGQALHRDRRMTSFRAIAASLLITVAASSIGCGYLLYPERRGQQGGYIAGGTLVMDLLWLIPGVVPGVVFLIVDFTSGGMYVSGRVAMNHANGNVAVRLADAKQAKTLELRIVDAKQHVLADQTAFIGPDVHHQTVLLSVGTQPTHEKLYLQILDADHAAKPLQLPIELM
jgi:hypothetical protein